MCNGRAHLWPGSYTLYLYYLYLAFEFIVACFGYVLICLLATLANTRLHVDSTLVTNNEWLTISLQ